MKKSLITFGIPTCYGGKPLLRAVKSIYNSAGNIPVEVRIVSDSNPLEKEILEGLKKLGAYVTENKTSGSQFKKLKQIVDQVKTPYFVFTQDDIFFKKDSVPNLVAFIEKHPEASLISTQIASAPARKLFERITEEGVTISYQMGRKWRNGDNYLLASGRSMVFKTSAIQKMRIPEKVVNGDAFLYFENKRIGGICVYNHDTVIVNNNPQTLKEHINQAKRFQYSFSELAPLFDFDLTSEYRIPKSIVIPIMIQRLFKQPIYFPLYIGLLIYSKVVKTRKEIVARTSWSIAMSTKRK